MKKRIFVAIMVMMIAYLGYAGFSKNQNVNATNTRIVTVHIDGEDKVVATTAKTVGKVLEKLETPVSQFDKTEPTSDAEVTGGEFKINVYRARLVAVVDGANSYTVMTAERTPRLIASEAGFKTSAEDQFEFSRGDDPFEGAPGTQMVIKRAKTINFDLYGTSSSIRTHETTVDQFLSSRDIELSSGDELNVPIESRITEGMTISLAQVERNLETVEEVAPFSEQQIKDAQQPTTYKKVQTPGVNGKKLVTYETVIRNGGAPERTAVKEVITEQPVQQVVVVGAKSNTFDGPFGEALAKLRSCEGSYTSNTGNGYYGAYQFNVGTWRASAPAGYGDVLPSNAPPSVQDEAAASLYKRRGWQPWPGCTKKLGLQDIYR
jgi:uncharacterized protein YabE (DUF348 family)